MDSTQARVIFRNSEIGSDDDDEIAAQSLRNPCVLSLQVSVCTEQSRDIEYPRRHWRQPNLHRQLMINEKFFVKMSLSKHLHQKFVVDF